MIRLERISRTFEVGGELVRALREVDLEIPDGDYLSIMGPSGSGKSTLLNIIGLLDTPTSGRYLLDGQEVARLGEREQAAVRRERIGFVFQFFHLIPRLTAQENIELPLVLAGVAPAERRSRVQEILDSLGLADRARHRPDQLSGGQRQRVAIGRAAVTEPEVILADEPTGNLDSKTGQEILELFGRLNAEGRTIVMVTHDDEVAAICGRQIRMRDGRVEEGAAC